MKNVLTKKAVLTACLIGLGVNATGVLADSEGSPCMRTYEVYADKTQFVEMHLRIATLQCRSAEFRSMQPKFNNFVRRNRAHFVDTETPLRKFVQRIGKGTLDRYVTSIANRISLDGGSANQFCARSLVALEAADKASEPVKILSLLPVKYEQPVGNCDMRQTAQK